MSINKGETSSFPLAPTPSLETKDLEWRQCISDGVTRLWQSQALFDYTLVAEGRSFRCHRTVLASVSDYFYAMLTSGMTETQQDYVELKAINAGMLQLLLDHVYTGILHITEDNVIDLLTTADHLQISTAIKACLIFLNTNISVDNCVEIMDTARLHPYDRDFSNKVEDFVAKNLHLLIESDTYLNLSYDSINRLLCREDLMFGPEEKLYQAVVQWLEHDPENRMQFHIDLMEHIRFPLMTAKQVDTIIDTHSELMKNPVLNKHLKKAQGYLAKPVYQRVLCQNIHTQLRMKPSLLAIRCDDNWSALSTNKGKWHNVRSVDIGDIDVSGCIIVNDFILMCGGHAAKESKRECYIFDPREYKWTELASMCVPRCTFALVKHKQFLYAVAGYSNIETNPSTNIERYNFMTNQWEAFTKMYSGWSDDFRLSACVVNDTIYICEGDADEYLDPEITPSKISSLDIVTKEWKMLPSTQIQPYGSPMWFQGGLLYFVHGIDHIETSHEPSIHWYDPKTGDAGLVFCPTSLPDQPRSFIDNERLYLIDGDSDGTGTPCVEVVIQDKSASVNKLDSLPRDNSIALHCVKLCLPWHQFVHEEDE